MVVLHYPVWRHGWGAGRLSDACSGRLKFSGAIWRGGAFDENQRHCSIVAHVRSGKACVVEKIRKIPCAHSEISKAVKEVGSATGPGPPVMVDSVLT